MSYKITIDTENKIIVYKHGGIVTKEEIGKAWTEFLSMIEFTELKYNLFSDYTEADFKIGIDDIELIADFLETLKGILFEKKQALIMSGPNSTALSLLFEAEVTKRTGFNVRVFTTPKAAYNWLKINN